MTAAPEEGEAASYSSSSTLAASEALKGDAAEKVRELSALFFAGAAAVDSADMVPASHLNALASAGMYGIFAPVSQGGLGLGYAEGCAVVEELASSCLASTFVWVQHFRFLGAMVDPTVSSALRRIWLGPAVRGDVKAGVALTGLLPGPPRLTARPMGEGWTLEGEARWVSGWGVVELVFVVARGRTRRWSRCCSTPGLSRGSALSGCACRPRTPAQLSGSASAGCSCPAIEWSGCSRTKRRAPSRRGCG